MKTGVCLILKKLERSTRSGHDIVYMDETGFVPETNRSHGYSIKGSRIYGDVDSNRRPRIFLIGGYKDGKLIAPVLFSGNCNTDTMNIWLKDHLLPGLRPGSVIVMDMDNATFHKSQETRDIIKAAGCFVLFLPPYSPHLNPIEKLWANIKHAWKYEPQHSFDKILVSSNYIWN